MSVMTTDRSLRGAQGDLNQVSTVVLLTLLRFDVHAQVLVQLSAVCGGTVGTECRVLRWLHALGHTPVVISPVLIEVAGGLGSRH